MLLNAFCNTNSLISLLGNQTLACVSKSDVLSNIEVVNTANDVYTQFVPSSGVMNKIEHFKDVNGLNFGQLVENEPKILIASRDHAEPEFFYKSISHYINGFSDGQANFWIGLDTLNKVTTTHEYKLRVVAYTNNNIEFVEEYLVFRVGNASEGWRLNVAGLVLGIKLKQNNKKISHIHLKI